MSGRQRIQREPSSGATAANSSGGQSKFLISLVYSPTHLYFFFVIIAGRSGRDPAQIYAGPGKTFKVKVWFYLFLSLGPAKYYQSQFNTFHKPTIAS